MCGNGVPEAHLDEECDRGDKNSDEGWCTLECKRDRCGDGLIRAGVELCDDGPDNRDDGPCTPLCAPPSCGDGILQGAELCDEGENNRRTTLSPFFSTLFVFRNEPSGETGHRVVIVSL